MSSRLTVTFAVLASVMMSACGKMTPDEQTVAGVTGEATAGIITAEALEADKNWRLITALSGASVGTLVAKNQATNRCAFSRGDETYSIAPCSL